MNPPISPNERSGDGPPTSTGRPGGSPGLSCLDSAVNLGGLHLPNRLLCAPMAGVSDRTFRFLVREAGCALAFPEMISDKALLFGNTKTADLAGPYQEESPRALQLLGRDPQTLARAALLAAERFGATLIDINMGCPAPKVTRNGEGAALLRDPLLCGAIIERVRHAVPARIAVSCKIRLGLDRPRGLEVTRAVADAGADFVTVHGRLATQSYSTPANWEAVAGIVETVGTPIVGNGDVLEPADARRLLETTGCQAVMIGRGALGNPWIFERSLRLDRTGAPGPPPGPVPRVAMALRHLRLAVTDKGERSAILEMRRHGAWYIKGLPGASAVRARLMTLTSAAAVSGLLEEYLATLRGAAT